MSGQGLAHLSSTRAAAGAQRSGSLHSSVGAPKRIIGLELLRIDGSLGQFAYGQCDSHLGTGAPSIGKV